MKMSWWLAFGVLALAEVAAAETREPYAGAISLAVPKELGNQRLAEMGLVDVTAVPFSADPTGAEDSTHALQQAVVFAREHQMVAFFPPGTYTIHDTLECVHGRHDPVTRKVRRGNRDWPCVLVGSRSGTRRPVIVLAPNSPGFGDPEHPKYVLHFWARAVDEGTYDDPQPNINMNQMLIGIDVTIGQGNRGAVAIRHRAAQGSSIQDVTIDATHGYCGLEGGAGSGGSHAGVTVIGGRIGVDLRQTQPAPTITGFTLIGQTDTAVLYSGRQSLAAVGLRIESDTTGPVIVTREPWAPHNGQVCLVDSTIIFRQAGANTAIDAGASLVLENVYLRNARTIVRHDGQPRLESDKPGWTRVGRYALGFDPPSTPRRMSKTELQYRMPVFVDGKRQETAWAEEIQPGVTPPEDLQARHLWDDDFPTWETPGTVNVKQPPYRAAGDGFTDDTDAIQHAVDKHRVVFLPKGIYRIRRTIRLRPETRLIGVHRCFSWILPDKAAGGDFGDARKPRPLVATADAAESDTILAFVGLRTPFVTPGAYCLDWRCGRRSVFRAVNVVFDAWPRQQGKGPAYDHPLVIIQGNGGGRWYNYHQESSCCQGPNYRHLLIQGTRQPLHFYQCNPEHARSDTNMEIRDARFVSIYGLKGEYNHPILTIRDSDQIRVFGYGGNAAALPGRSLFVVQRTPNVLLANLVDSPRLAGAGSAEHFAGQGVDPHLWHMVLEEPNAGAAILTPPLDRPVLYLRGNPNDQ